MKVVIEKNDIYLSLIAFILIFPFIDVNAYNSLIFLKPIIDNNNLIILLYVVGLSYYYIEHWSEHRLFALWAGLFLVVIVLCTVINNPRETRVALLYGFRMIAFFEIWDIFGSSSKMMIIILKVVDNYLSLLFLLTLFFQFYQQDIFGYTESMNYVNFFVSDNELAFYVLIHFGVIIAKSNSNIGIIDIVKIMLDMIMLFKTWSASGIIAGILCLGLMIASRIREFSFISRLFWQIVILVCLQLLLIANTIIEVLNHVTIDIFNKSIDSSRRVIWLSTLNNIRSNFWLGHGTTQGGRLSINYVAGKHWFAHNWFLEYLSQGGIVFLSVLLLLIILCIRETNRLNNHTSYLLLCIFFSFQVLCLTEAWITHAFFYLIYILLLYIESYKTQCSDVLTSFFPNISFKIDKS